VYLYLMCFVLFVVCSVLLCLCLYILICYVVLVQGLPPLSEHSTAVIVIIIIIIIIQEFRYRDTANVEPEMYDYITCTRACNWSNWNSN
jgi:hypothetical protein